ncbi:MAG TPA: hypothetical protein ENI23_06910 [bacterium]|nr:hypothetical protein [bacterium]
MPDEIKTNKEVLAESTAVAQEAARVSGQTFTSGTSITAETLNEQALVTLPDAPVSTASAGLSTEIVEGSRLQRGLAEKREKAEVGLEKEKGGVVQTMQDILGIQASRGRREEEAGLPDLLQKTTDIQNQIEAKELSIRREIEEAEKNLEGMGTFALRDTISDIQREGTRELADLAIIQNAANRNFTTAQAIADRRIQNELEPLQQKLEFQKFFFDENKEVFNREEKRQFENLIRENERELKAEEKRLNEINTVGMEFLKAGGDPSKAQDIFNSKTTNEAIQKTGGQFGIEARLRNQKLLKEITDITTNLGFITDPKERFKAETDLAKAYELRTKDFTKAQQQIRTIQIAFDKAQRDILAGKSINAASQGVLVSFQKLLDPTSVVRESEYARSGQGLGLISRIEGKATQIAVGGAGVTAEDLQEFNDLSQLFFEGFLESAIQNATLITNQATTYGLNIDNIIPAEILNVMTDQFRRLAQETEIGETFMIGVNTYLKNGEDNFELIQ